MNQRDINASLDEQASRYTAEQDQWESLSDDSSRNCGYSVTYRCLHCENRTVNEARVCRPCARALVPLEGRP